MPSLLTLLTLQGNCQSCHLAVVPAISCDLLQSLAKLTPKRNNRAVARTKSFRSHFAVKSLLISHATVSLPAWPAVNLTAGATAEEGSNSRCCCCCCWFGFFANCCQRRRRCRHRRCWGHLKSVSCWRTTSVPVKPLLVAFAKTKRAEAKRSKAKQSKVKQSKLKQSKVRSKAKPASNKSKQVASESESQQKLKSKVQLEKANVVS